MSKKLRLVHVHKVQDLTPHLRRLTLHGESLADFPTGMEGAHVKIVVPKQGQDESMLSMLNKLAPLNDKLWIEISMVGQQ